MELSDKNIEFECEKCEGKGSYLLETEYYEDVISCIRCNGTGKVDWIDNIIPKKSIKIWGQKTLEKDKGFKNV